MDSFGRLRIDGASPSAGFHGDAGCKDPIEFTGAIDIRRRITRIENTAINGEGLPTTPSRLGGFCENAGCGASRWNLSLFRIQLSQF